MTEDTQLKQAYADLLGSSDDPRLGGAEGAGMPQAVAARIKQRRRRRHTLVGLAAAAVLAGGGWTAYGVWEGGPDTPVADGSGGVTIAKEAPTVTPLVLRRGDETWTQPADLQITCTNNLLMIMGAPPSPGAKGAVVTATVPIDKVEPGQTVTFDGKPMRHQAGDGSTADAQRLGPTFFAAVAPEGWSEAGGAQDTIVTEGYSYLDDTTGTLRVIEATCTPTPRLHLSLDLTLGTESGPGRVQATGDFVVGDAPQG